MPYLALAAAFAFIIMMFNLPTPFGSTGHAVGSGLIAIILGPWVAVVTVSVALLIQALLFGDGGITAFGANCFNMAVVIPFVAFYTYSFISGKTKITSNRRILGAGISGWLGLTAAAGVAGFEMGIQPLLEHTADGVPIYMPYGLAITVPAMVLEHALFFSIVEAIITALAFGYIARTDPTIIFNYKGRGEETKGAIATAPAGNEVQLRGRLLRNLLVVLAILIIAVPVGLLAVGTAYGEWGAGELKLLAGFAPAGLGSISSLWAAPIPDYSLPSLGGTFLDLSLVYWLSAIVGVILSAGAFILIGRMLTRKAAQKE